MRCPKHRRILSSKSCSQHVVDICPRCTRSTRVNKAHKNPRLLTYYRSLCKSSKCLIHKRNGCAKFNKQAALKKKKSQLSKVPGTKLRNILKKKVTEIPYVIDEFEEKNSQDDIDFKMFQKIDATVEEWDNKAFMSFNDSAGYKILKDIINKTIIWPLKKPDTFKGLRAPPRGVLLFGPPGTGKTFLGKLIACETKSTFFNISPSILTSKWMGENEKLVRTMFLVAKARQPSVIFFDEIDSILSKSARDENGCLRRMKNEFFVCMGDSDLFEGDRIMVIGTTNRPSELDDGARHKFNKRLYVPLPNMIDRKEILLKLLECECHSLEEIDLFDIVKKTEGYSVADLKNLCQEAAMGPVKTLAGSAINHLKPDKIRPISMEDFLWALQLIKPTVSLEQIKNNEEWDSLYGYGGEPNTVTKKSANLEQQFESKVFQGSSYIT